MTVAVAANVRSKPQCPAELLTTHFFVRRGIERVEELNTSPRASVCCLLAAAAYHHHIELAVLSSEFSAAHVLDPSIGSAKQLTSAEEMPNLPNAGRCSAPECLFH
jgi:hypothetical protein